MIHPLLRCRLLIELMHFAGFIYYPDRDECFEAYRRGPCQFNQYLTLVKDNVIPVCVPNPCNVDGLVNFAGKCYQLDTQGPCPPTHIDNLVGVNETTLEVICTRGFINTRFSDTSTVPTPVDATPTYVDGEYYRKNECLLGGKRWKNERCPQQVQLNQALADVYGPRN